MIDQWPQAGLLIQASWHEEVLAFGVKGIDMDREQDAPSPFGAAERDETFGTNLRRALALKGLRPAQLARSLGLSGSAVNQWLHGRTVPGTRRLAEIAAFVGVQASDLMGHEGSGTNPQAAQSETAMIHIPVLPMQLQITPDDAGDAIHTLDRSKAKGDPWVVPREAVCFHASDDPDLCIIRVQGNAMAPAFRAGDYALVDLNWNELSSPGIYLIAQVAWPVMRRCDLLAGEDAGKVRMTSTDEGYSETVACIDEVEVIGRVICNMLVPR